MTVFAINRVSRDVLHDPAFREALLRDPAATLAALDLSADEQAALLAGEVGVLYRMGANAYLMGNLFRFGAFGLTFPDFNSRMRAVQPLEGGH